MSSFIKKDSIDPRVSKLLDKLHAENSNMIEAQKCREEYNL